MNFTPFPCLSTARLLLRPLREQDKLAIFFMRSDDKVNKYIARKKFENIDQAISFIDEIRTRIINGEMIYWAISLIGNDELIGTICLWKFSTNNNSAELGYALKPEFQNKGLMNEAVLKVIDFAANQLNIKVLEAHTSKHNFPSISLLEKVGFNLVEGKFDNDFPLNIVFDFALNKY